MTNLRAEFNKSISMAAIGMSRYQEPGMQAEDLAAYRPHYEVPKAWDLDHLDEGDFIKIAFINREDIW